MPSLIHEIPVIGMSPGNSYFKDDKIAHLLKNAINDYRVAAVFIADIPAISTYLALGYSELRARRDKAIPKGNALKNKVQRLSKQAGYTSKQVLILDWGQDVENNSIYKTEFEKIDALYKTNSAFCQAVREATLDVLENSGKAINDKMRSVDIAVHYLLSELAALEFLPTYFKSQKVVYIYHKEWPIYESYIAGKFDGKSRPHLRFKIVI